MPIKKENRDRYPPDWKEIRMRSLRLAHHRCENCGVHDRAWGWRDHNGEFHKVRKQPLLDAGYDKPPFVVASDKGDLKIIEIILTIAHLDHTPENCDPDNLRAWCQRCHLSYDANHHAMTRAATRKQQLEDAGQLDMIGSAP